MLRALGRRCRATGGRWNAVWVACSCPEGQAFVAHRGCATRWSPTPIDPACAACAAPAHVAPCPWRCTAHLATPHARWHRGRASAAARALHPALSGRAPWPAGLAPLEPGGLPGLPVVYLDVAGLRRWWPQAAPWLGVHVPWAHAALALWAPPERAPKLRRALRRVLAAADGRPGGAPAPADDPRLEAATGWAMTARRARQAGGERGHRALLYVTPAPHGALAWCAQLRLVRHGVPLVFRVAGAGAQVLSRTLTVGPASDWASPPPGEPRAVCPVRVHFDQAGRPLGFDVSVGAEGLSWYDARGSYAFLSPRR